MNTFKIIRSWQLNFIADTYYIASAKGRIFINFNY